MYDLTKEQRQSYKPLLLQFCDEFLCWQDPKAKDIIRTRGEYMKLHP